LIENFVNNSYEGVKEIFRRKKFIRNDGNETSIVWQHPWFFVPRGKKIEYNFKWAGREIDT
jgi:hypothetical protein